MRRAQQGCAVREIFLDNPDKYVHHLFMSAASATAALPNDPDPPPDRTADRAPTQSGAGRVLGLLRKLIDYGQELARTVQQRAAAGTLFTVALHFGTRDIALILARITRGLRLANALEAGLISRPVRQDDVPARVRAPADRTKCTARRAVKRPGLPDVPTAEEIAAALRHRPAAAVIADICRDLGIVPAHPLWREVMTVIAGHGGNFERFFTDVMDRVCTLLTAPSAVNADGWPVPRSQPAAACGTGPP
jgi:hypothetical protein